MLEEMICFILHEENQNWPHTGPSLCVRDMRAENEEFDDECGHCSYHGKYACIVDCKIDGILRMAYLKEEVIGVWSLEKYV